MTVQLVPTSQISEEYGRIEYELQLQLNAPRLSISECYELSNPRVHAEFQAYCKALPTQNIVDVFINTADINQLMTDISTNGIKVDPSRGFRFRVGSFNIDRTKETIEVIRLQIALGVTLNFQKVTSDYENGIFTDEQPTSANLKTGYHSLCISDRHDFVVFNSSQIKTCNLIKFKGGKDLQPINEDDSLCDLCNTERATIWCINDSAKLCQKCDETSHAMNKILQKHKRINLTDARAMMEFCPIHPEEKVEYFCPVCQAPVCIICKMSGSHSKDEKSAHPLIPLRVAYAESLEASKKNDESLNRKIDMLDEKIKSNESKMQRVLHNAKEVEEEILRLASNAIEQCKALAGEKALLIRSAQTELQRKKEELLLNSKFLDIQKNSVGPLSFLKAFSRHQKMLNDLHRLDDLQPEVRADADLCVFGSLEVQATSNSPVIARTAGNDYSYNYNSPGRSNSPQQNSPSQYSSKKNSPSQYSSKQYSPKTRSSNISPSRRISTPKGPLDFPRSKLPEFSSLIEIARRKDQKNREKGLELNFQPFHGSLIIENPSLCCELYLCFPFRTLPKTHLLFSTERDGRNIATMHSKIDGIGISTVLVKNSSNGFVFGGFAAAKWNTKGEPFGDKSSTFLFSMTQDAFIPYRPQVPDACYLYATNDTLTFGKYDLILADNFDRCSAVIENSYGIGLPQGSYEAQCFLAGEPEFVADIVEVWGFFTTSE